MRRTRKQIESNMTIEKVKVLLTAFEIIANGNPISVGVDEIDGIAQIALDFFDEN